MKELGRFMAVAIVLGVITVSSGLVLNIINSWRTRDFRSALLGSKGAAGAVLYWIVLVLIARAFVPGTERVPDAVIFILLAIAIALLIGGRLIVRRLEAHARVTRHVVRATPWWLGALEASIELVDTLFSFFANTISFVRVAAFAAVHAGVFIAIFALADTISHLRMGGVLSILVHVAANVVVILLEGLTVSVQVLRLEYYEFFGKFFRGGGEAYKPFAVGTGAEEVHKHVS
jgi:V/A-type H+-transporting ATPase subunit I